MRKLITYLSILLVAILPIRAQVAQVDTDTIGASTPKVLIINSYQVETDWSENVINAITAKLVDLYPDIFIHVGHMNLNTYTLSSNPLYTLRSILWSYADSSSETISAEDPCLETLFASGSYPDVLIFIGDDALLFYQAYGPLLKEWKDVPIVVCGSADQAINSWWLPCHEYDFDSFEPIENRRETEMFVYKKECINVDSDLTWREQAVDTLPDHMVAVNYNLTGVKYKLPIRENLQLIRQIMPELKEVVWLDNGFYSAFYAEWLLKKELPTILPDVKFSRITQNQFNSDSIFNEVLKPESDKIFLSYSWDVNGIYSKQTDEQTHVLFNNYSSIPLISLTQRSLSNPYWLGGYYRLSSEFADKTVDLVSRILQGESANDIPFEEVTKGKTVLDRSLLEKYELWQNVKDVPGIELFHIPPTYYQRNEGVILIGVIICAILLGLLIYWLSGILYTRKAQKELVRYRKLYNKLNLIYGHTSIDLALYDKEGELIFSIERGWERTSGGGGDDLFSGNLFQNQNLTLKQIEQIQRDEPLNSEVAVGAAGAPASEYKVYQLMVNSLNDDNAQSAKYVVIAMSLNEIVREREERERFESLVRFASDSSQMGIAFYNIDTCEGTATNSWYQNLNETITPGLLPTYKNVMSEDRESLVAYRERARLGEEQPPFLRDIRVLGKSGDTHWITQHIFVNENNSRMLIELNLNIDEQKKHEADLLSAKDKVERSILETEKFLANINHEIRTPLNSIVGFSAILADSVQEEERKEYIALILKNNELLTMLIDDVIELSKIDSGQATFERKPIKVDELFKKVMKTGYSNLYNKQLDIVLELSEPHTVVYSDAESLYRLMKNLFSNAIKFTEEGSVTLGYRKIKGRHHFFVKDTGCGISAENRERVFERFDKINPYAQGTGLGLALCKSIVEQLGGEIGLESEVGKGSTFWFEI